MRRARPEPTSLGVIDVAQQARALNIIHQRSSESANASRCGDRRQKYRWNATGQIHEQARVSACP